MLFLITGAWKNAREHFAEIESIGHKIVFMQQEQDDIPCDPALVEGVICNGLFLYHDIKDFSNLRYVQLTSAGLDRVPLDYIKEKRIKINNARGVYSIPMAEFAIAGVLDLYKKMRFFADNQRAHKWEKRRDLLELDGRKVCVFGCGSVGNECAKRFSAFGCEVIGVDLYPREDSAYSNIYPLEDTQKVLAIADIVVLTLPLTEKTRHLFGDKEFSLMKENAMLVNISRGGVIDTKALENALLNKRISGAVLDVFENEPLEESSPLWDMENVIVTPHNSFVGDGNDERLCGVIFDNLKG